MCDLVDDSIVGEARQNLLRIVDLRAQAATGDADYLTLTYEQPHFYPVTMTNPNSVRIALLDAKDGKPLTTDEKNAAETFVTLQFRRKHQ